MRVDLDFPGIGIFSQIDHVQCAVHDSNSIYPNFPCTSRMREETFTRALEKWDFGELRLK
jgi:hypothetical protein